MVRIIKSHTFRGNYFSHYELPNNIRTPYLLSLQSFSADVEVLPGT
jgi:hypothetical protein